MSSNGSVAGERGAFFSWWVREPHRQHGMFDRARGVVDFDQYSDDEKFSYRYEEGRQVWAMLEAEFEWHEPHPRTPEEASQMVERAASDEANGFRRQVHENALFFWAREE